MIFFSPAAWSKTNKTSEKATEEESFETDYTKRSTKCQELSKWK